MAYENGKIYFNNYRTCYTACGYKGLPRQLYQLPQQSASEKIEEGIICQAQLDLSSLPADHRDHRHCFLALTANNHLVRYDISTGEVLQQIYLSNRYKFRHVAWDCEEYTVTVKSTHNKMSNIARQAGPTPCTLLMALAVFTVFPLQFVAMMEVTKKIFGHDITDSMISHGVVIVMHQGGMVRLYSFQHVLQMGKMSDKDHCQASPAMYPTGLPLNIKLNKRPPLMFEVKCAEHIMSLGAVPWHYIITPPGSKGYFKVYALENKQLADSGLLDLDNISIEPDKCLFHPDDSGKILHVGCKQAQVLKVSSRDCQSSSSASPKSRIELLYKIEPFKKTSLAKPEQPLFTSSGRVIKKASHYTEDMVEDSYENIATVDYEDDLDLLFMGLVCQGHAGLEGKVHLYDNTSGALLKEVVLDEPWKEFCDHVISVDLDTLVHIVKAPMRKFSCYVYRLRRSIEEQTPKSKTKDTVSGSSGHRDQRPRRNRRTINYDDS